MKISRCILMVLAAAAALLLPACEGGDEIPGNCKVDADCDPGFHCGPAFFCLCISDASCADDEYCNAEGYCQKLQGCRTDSECGDPDLWGCQIGETKVGDCLCKSDLACKDDEFCNTSGICQKRAGCIIDEDCGAVADWRCVIDPATQIGQCLCKTDNACDAGEFCNVHGYCQPVDVCRTDDDCPTGQFCDTETGKCLCDPETQTGCGAEEICNASGYCQPRPGCYNNADCEHLVDHYCDITTRTCIPIGTCNSDRQCPLGQVCRQQRCVDGCNNNDDCPLDQCCINFRCESCDCQEDSFCEFAEFCVGGQCQAGYTEQTPYCKPCERTNLLGCGDRSNSCLIYGNYDDDAFVQEYPFPLDPGERPEYCAPDCANNQRCPKGFRCNSVVTIKQTDLCQTSSECPSDLPCLKSPEEAYGFCPCHNSKNPCMSNTCMNADICMGGTCFSLGIAGIDLPCSNDADCYLCSTTLLPCQTSADCMQIQCELYEGYDFGGCVSAKACGLEEGYHCPPPSQWP